MCFIVALSPAHKPAGLTDIAVAVVGFIGVAALPVGFFISTITLFVLRLIFTWSPAAYHADLSEQGLKRIWPLLRIERDHTAFTAALPQRGLRWIIPTCFREHLSRRGLEKRVMGHVATVFDHGVLYTHCPGLHEWLARSYTAYTATANGAMTRSASCAMLPGPERA